MEPISWKWTSAPDWRASTSPTGALLPPANPSFPCPPSTLVARPPWAEFRPVPSAEAEPRVWLLFRPTSMTTLIKWVNADFGMKVLVALAKVCLIVTTMETMEEKAGKRYKLCCLPMNEEGGNKAAGGGSTWKKVPLLVPFFLPAALVVAVLRPALFIFLLYFLLFYPLRIQCHLNHSFKRFSSSYRVWTYSLWWSWSASSTVSTSVGPSRGHHLSHHVRSIWMHAKALSGKFWECFH